MAGYMAFIINAVAFGWLARGNFGAVDNVIVYSGGSADILLDILWNALGLDGYPLRIIVVHFSIRVSE